MVRRSSLILFTVSLPLFTTECHESTDTLLVPAQTRYERLMEFATEEGNAGSLVDFLNWMEAEPLDINRATTAELEQIPGMSPVLANRIAYFRAVRPIERLEDLTQVEGMTPQLLGEMAALTWVGSKSTRARSRGTNVLFRVLVSRDLDLQPEYEQGKFLGTAERVCNRLVVHSGGIESVTKTGSREGSVESPSFACGLVTEKDPWREKFPRCRHGATRSEDPKSLCSRHHRRLSNRGGAGIGFFQIVALLERRRGDSECG